MCVEMDAYSSSWYYFLVPACRAMSSLNFDATETTGKKPDIPAGVKVGDFLVARYLTSEWSRFFPWEDWDHAALVTRVKPLTIVESSGIILQRKDKRSKKEEIREGVVEYEFSKPRIVQNLDGSKNADGNLWLKSDLVEILWLRPVFPNPLREMDHWKKSWKKRRHITEAEARKRAVAFARSQVGEPFNISIKAHKWNTKIWYCSLLIFKSYSRTVTNMRLENYKPAAGWYVVPEDLVKSKRSTIYHRWFNQQPSSTST